MHPQGKHTGSRKRKKDFDSRGKKHNQSLKGTMTASTPPLLMKPLSDNLDVITNGNMEKLPMKNKGKANHTVGYFYSMAPAVVSDPPKSPNARRNSTEATKQSTNDDQSQSPIKNLSSGSSSQDTIDHQHSPQSVVPLLMHANEPTSSVLSTTNTSFQQPQVVRSTSSQKPEAGAPQSQSQFRRVKIERNYDMNLVPKIKKNPEFLKVWRKISIANVGGDKSFSHTPSTFSLPGLVSCDNSCGDSSHYSDVVMSEANPLACPSYDSSSSSSSIAAHEKEPHLPCHACLVPGDTTALPPFGPNFESVIWAPKTRSDWEESIDEMVAVCSAAAWHKHKSDRSKKNKDFHPPISRIYIRDRIEIDDPLRGYQIRHKTGGWLQGFVMMTNFTTWTHYFKWDSNHPSNGIHHDKPNGFVDDGSFSEGLERQPRSGDPLAEGVVWPTIAEMSLVGALGCGEYLLQMALDDIARRGTYDYVVLEATDMSRPFYEKFGFVRVGAVCKYGNEKDVKDANGEVQDVGYRHWTYATESEQRLNEHGAPSCMMARRIKKFDPDVVCEGCEKAGTPSFVDQLGRYFALDKPNILPLGANRRKRTMSSSSSSNGSSTKKAKTIGASVVTSSGRKSKVPSRLDEEVQERKIKPKKSATTPKRTEPKKVEVEKTKPQEAGPEPMKIASAPTRIAPPRTSKNSSLPPIAPLEQDLFKTKGKTSKTILLRKQKIPTMYRSPKKLYFYNKVVTPKPGEDKSKYKSKYYFVISFDMEAKQVSLIPLYLRGTFKGKREGRPKWKANVLPRTNLDDERYLKSMDVIAAPVSKWEIVKSYAVTKCASVQEESWDVLA